MGGGLGEGREGSRDIPVIRTTLSRRESEVIWGMYCDMGVEIWGSQKWVS